MATGPRCFRCWMLMLSGPVDLLVLLFAMAVVISCSDRVKSVSGLRCLMWRSMERLTCWVL